MRSSLRIAIADDHGLCRDGLRALLADTKDIRVVAETHFVAGIIPMLEKTACDVLLLDLQMDRSAMPLVASLAARIPLVVLTTAEPTAVSLEAMRAGARAVVPKRLSGNDLVAAIRAVAIDGRWMPADLREALVRELSGEAVPALTDREREIAGQVALGLRNGEIARKLFISEQTVKTHLNNVFSKLGVRDRVELTLFALRSGLIALQ